MATVVTGKTSIGLRKFNTTDTLIVTMHVTREFRLRVKLATWLIVLAGHILGMGVKVDVDSEGG